MTITKLNWAQAGSDWSGEVQGRDIGATVSLIFTSTSRVGEGPSLHHHPYDETFIVLRGSVIFSDGENRIEAGAGDIIVVPRETPHGFASASENLVMTSIHAASAFRTEWHEP